jgi:hypothetical protein
MFAIFAIELTPIDILFTHGANQDTRKNRKNYGVDQAPDRL